jgi:TRAP-type C4-dicarboxylate transport system permease small subunit
MNRILRLPVLALSALSAVLVLALMFMISIDVSLRYLFNSPINGVTELTEISVVSIVFAQTALAVRHYRLTRSDTLLGAIGNWHKRTATVMRAIAELIGAAIFLLIAFKAQEKLGQAWHRDLYTGTKGVFTMPEWPYLSLVTVGSYLITLQFLANALSQISARDGASE